MFGRILAASVAALCLGIFACSTTVSATDPTGSSSGSNASTGGATGAQVDNCKEACNKMKFFGCNTADEQAACYSDCGSASASQIEVFVNCAGTSVCDPQCRTNITPKPANGQPPSGGGATESSCTTACNKLVSCSFIKVSDNAACLDSCQKDAYQYQIDCVNNTACTDIQTACGGGGSSSGGSTSGGIDAGDPLAAVSIMRCQSSCDELLADSCINPANQAACRAKCSATTADKRDAFSSCVAQSSCQDNGNDCYTAF